MGEEGGTCLSPEDYQHVLGDEVFPGAEGEYIQCQSETGCTESLKVVGVVESEQVRRNLFFWLRPWFTKSAYSFLIQDIEPP